MNNILGKLLTGVSRFGAAIARDRLRRELMMVDPRVLARAGLTHQDVLDTMNPDREPSKPSATHQTRAYVEALPIKPPLPSELQKQSS